MKLYKLEELEDVMLSNGIISSEKYNELQDASLYDECIFKGLYELLLKELYKNTGFKDLNELHDKQHDERNNGGYKDMLSRYEKVVNSITYNILTNKRITQKQKDELKQMNYIISNG